MTYAGPRFLTFKSVVAWEFTEVRKEAATIQKTQHTHAHAITSWAMVAFGGLTNLALRALCEIQMSTIGVRAAPITGHQHSGLSGTPHATGVCWQGGKSKRRGSKACFESGGESCCRHSPGTYRGVRGCIGRRCIGSSGHSTLLANSPSCEVDVTAPHAHPVRGISVIHAEVAERHMFIYLPADLSDNRRYSEHRSLVIPVRASPSPPEIPGRWYG